MNYSDRKQGRFLLGRNPSSGQSRRRQQTVEALETQLSFENSSCEENEEIFLFCSEEEIVQFAVFLECVPLVHPDLKGCHNKMKQNTDLPQFPEKKKGSC